MESRKSKSLKALKSAVSECEKSAENSYLNGLKRLCMAYISTGDERQRERAIKKIVRQENGLTEMLRQNDDILIANAERALYELACGCTVTERRIKTTPQGRIVEEITKQLPPNQSALEFLLTNKASDSFVKNPEAKTENGDGRIKELVEALKNVR